MGRSLKISDALRSARIAAGLSQRELALAAGLHQPLIAKAEQGRDLRLSTLAALGGALGLEISLVPRTGFNGVAMAANARDAQGGSELLRRGRSADGDDLVESTVVSYAREWPMVDPQVFAVIARIMRAGQYLAHTLEQLGRAKGLNTGEVLLLGALRRKGPPYESTPSELRKWFWISLPGITKRLNRLEDFGLIERAENPADRRQSLVRLTRKGHEVQDGYPLATEFAIINQMESGERLVLSTLLRSLLVEFERHPAGEVDRAKKWSKAVSVGEERGLTRPRKGRKIRKLG